MTRRNLFISLSMLLLLGLSSPAPAELTAEQQKAAAGLIEQFGAREFAVRQQAVEDLIRMGPDVLPPVRKALVGTKDNEVKLRCEMVIKALAPASGGPGLPTVLEGHSASVLSVAFSRNGKMLASGGEDKTVRIWEVATGKTVVVIAAHAGNVSSVAFSPDGKTLASASWDKTIKLWDAATGKELKSLVGHAGEVYCLAFSPDGKTLASGSADQTIKLWDVESGRNTSTLKPAAQVASDHVQEFGVHCVAFSPDGLTLASGAGAVIRMWDPASGKNKILFDGTGEGEQFFTPQVAFSPDGKMLAACAGMCMSPIRIFDLATGKSTVEPSNGSGSIAFAPAGGKLACTCGEEVRLFDAVAGKQVAQLKGNTETVHSVAFSFDGKILASGSEDKTIRLWDISAIEIADE